MSLSFLFSYIFIIVSVYALVYCIYIMRTNPRGILNRLFAASVVAMQFWAVGLALAISSSSMEMSLIWRHVSSLGWGTIHAIILHFLLILTGHDVRRRHLPLLYLPAALMVLAFSIPSGLNVDPYQMVYTTAGWVNVAINDGWDMLFYSYYIGYMLIGLLLVWRWGRKSRAPQDRGMARSLITTFGAAFLLGTLTDILASRLSFTLPQMAPVFLTIPLIAIGYNIRRNGLMADGPPDPNLQIMNESIRSTIFRFMIGLMLVCGGANIGLHLLFFGEKPLKEILPFSGFMLFISMVIWLIGRSRLGDTAREKAIAIGAGLIVPIATTQLSQSFGATAWVFVFALVMISLPYNRLTILVSIILSAIYTQFLLYAASPVRTVVITGADAVARTILLVITLALGVYVNRLYVSKLKEVAEQDALQRIISYVSFDFVSVDQNTLDEKVTRMLCKVGEFLRIDRSYVFLFSADRTTMSYTHEWCREGIHPEIGTIEDVPLDVFPWWIGQLRDRKQVLIVDVGALPAEAETEKEHLLRQNIVSLLSIPIEIDGKAVGFLGFDQVVSHRIWTEDHAKLLTVLANLVADGIIRTRNEREIERMAFSDHLTGLPNRRLFEDRLSQAIHLARRTGKMVGVLFLDLDGFKAVNDTLGHKSGDLLISEVGRGLAVNLRKTDTVARFGGDEFLVLLNQISDVRDISCIVGNIMRLFEQPFPLGGEDYYVTASAGIAVFPIDGEEPDALVKNADIAMYKAKAKGKNQFVLCTEDMKTEVYTSMVLTNSLYRSLDRGEMSIHYQPQVDVASGRIVGMEALMRWNSPEHGPVPPGVFIGLAERNGLIGKFGEWVLRSACTECRRLTDLGYGPLRMAVNLSITQFRNPRLAELIEGILQETGLEPSCLELEITESIANREAGQIVDVLDRLKRLGVCVAIDDFGTEYSSLSRLKTLPIDRLKIDMQFVRGIERSEKDRAIIRVIISLANSLGLQVIAEGVETAEQLDYLTRNACDEVQGYYFHRPMPITEIERILETSRQDALASVENQR